MNKVYFGDCRDSMRQIAKDGIKVQTCITSPPYYGLRDYGTAIWIDGDKNCEHQGITISNNRNFIDDGGRGSNKKSISYGDCIKCGAKKQDFQIGNEQTPQEFIDNLVEVFACVWDVLADDGTLWVNLGDSYCMNSMRGENSAFKETSIGKNHNKRYEEGAMKLGKRKIPDGLKPKDLMGMPWRLAFALQEFGWYLRQDIIWHKPNPMPESVKDRCTKSHEYIFLLSKNPHYYFDNQAIQELANYPNDDRGSRTDSRRGTEANSMSGKTGETRNKRDVWTVATKPYSGAHFAVYPEELVQPMVLAGSRVGDIVLDPFFGSGTTGQVAQNLGRKWIGCELNKDYESLQNERLSQQGLEL